MKAIFSTIIAIFSLTMISCSNAEVFDDEMIGLSKGTRSSVEDAYVRIGMYENIRGYNLRVENMRVENCISTGEKIEFGTNIANAQVLPSTAEEAIFDNADGKYNAISYYENDALIVVHFDVVMTSAEDFESVMRIEDVKYYISPEKSSWSHGGHYEYVIKLDKDLLNLSEIDFGVDVEDFQNVNAGTSC